MRFATASLVKAPERMLAEWAAYHRNSGIDEMHIFFDDPQDPAFDRLDGRPGLICYRCDQKFWRNQVARSGHPIPTTVPEKQHVILQRLLRRRRLPIDWLAHIDSDELIWAPGDLREALERELVDGVDHVQMPPLEAVPPHLNTRDPFRDAHVFKEHRRDLYPLAKEQGVHTPFQAGTLLRGHRKGKSWVRFGRVKRMRVHGPTPSGKAVNDLVSGRAHDLRVLHFDSGTFRQWRRSWRNRSVYGDHMARPRALQAERFAAADSRPPFLRWRALRRLYREEYMLTPQDEQILRELGLVRTVRIDQSLFDLPSR